MPFKSQAQRAYLYANHPQIAKRWSEEYPNQGKLPQHVNGREKVTQAIMSRKRGY